MMTELTDAFVAIPGGIGTFDELFEAWSWNALGYHAKPFALLNVDGFWDGMIAFLDTCHGQRLHVAGAARAIAGRGRRSATRSTSSTRRSAATEAENGLVIPRGRAMVRQIRANPGGESMKYLIGIGGIAADPRHRLCLLRQPALDSPPRRRRRLRAAGRAGGPGARHALGHRGDRRDVGRRLQPARLCQARAPIFLFGPPAVSESPLGAAASRSRRCR